MKKLLYILLFISFSAGAQKISQLPAATAIGAADLIPIVQGGVNKKAPYSLFGGGGGGTSIETVAAISGSGTTVLTFDAIRYFQKTTQTGNITLSLAASGHLNGRTQVIDVDGNGSPLTIPTNWTNKTSQIFDATLNNVITLEYVNSKVNYSIVKSALPDLFAPTLVSASTNSSGTIITLLYNENLAGTPNYTVSGGKTISSQVINTNSVVITVTVPYVGGNVITVSGSGITDLTGNASATLASQSVTNNVNVVISDNFVSGNITDIVGRVTTTGSGVWVKETSTNGTIGIVSNKAQLTSSPSMFAKYTLTRGTRDIDARATIDVKGSNPLCILAYTDDNNTLYCNLATGNVSQSLASASTTIISPSTINNGDIIRFVLSGTTLNQYVNGTLRASGTVSASLTSTRHGIYFYQDNTSIISLFSIQ